MDFRRDKSKTCVCCVSFCQTCIAAQKHVQVHRTSCCWHAHAFCHCRSSGPFSGRREMLRFVAQGRAVFVSACYTLGMRCRHVCLLVWLHFLCLRSVGGSRLADLLTQRDAGTAMKVLKKVHPETKGGHMATVHEVKMLDRLCGLAFGVGLARFVPSYFASGVSCLRPGCLKADGLAPWADRPLLRVVADREKAGNAAQGYLCSRLRALEVSDPFHILWRIALNAINEAGCQGFRTTCSTCAYGS